MLLPVALLEREAELAQLGQAVQALAQGVPSQARVFVVQAPAGFGKTSMLRAAKAAAVQPVDWLWGTCEALVPAPPLGALLDLLDSLPPSLAHAVRHGRAGHELASGFLAALCQRARHCVLVIDDLQWADGATLDLLRFIARRIDSTQALLVLALRDDSELPDAVRAMLAALPAQSTARLPLAPLSQAAVAQLAAHAGRNSQELHRITRGHPFFVTQLLAAPAGVLPLAVRDVVLARLAAAPPGVRELLTLVSLSPRGLEASLLRQLLPGEAHVANVDAALHAQWLEQDGPWLRFRHDIVRQAVAAAVPPLQAAAWHQRLFEALAADAASLQRRVHHAQQAGLHAAVLALAPVAAQQASRLGAHRQAKQLYELALAARQAAPPIESVAQQAALHEAHALSCSAIYALDDAQAAWRAALQALRQAGQPLGVARALRELGRMEWHRGDIAQGMALVAESLQLLQGISETDSDSTADSDKALETARSQATMAHLHMMDDQPLRAVQWAEPALAAFEAKGEPAGLAYALNTVGAAQVLAGQAAGGWQYLQRGLALSLSLGAGQGAEGEVARAYTNLAGLALITHEHQRLFDWVAQGLDWCASRDQDMFAAALRTRQVLGLVHQGRWPEARSMLARLCGPDATATVASQRETELAQQLLNLLDLRQGVAPTTDDSTADPWPAYIAGDWRMRVTPWFLPEAVMRTEAAWIRGDPSQAASIASQALPQALAIGERWRIGRLACWAQRLGALSPDELANDLPDGLLANLPSDLPAPFVHELSGDARAAAQAWAALGCPYEQALCLLWGDSPARREAVEQLRGLGAQATAAAALRHFGHSAVPRTRGPYTHARHDAQGLTARERQVLVLLQQRLSNAQIASRLGRSERTVEKHVAAVLGKLGVASRHDLRRSD